MDKKAEYPETALRICVDQMKTAESDIKGFICGVAVEEEAPFSGSAELLLCVDKILDKIGKPQSSRKVRSFKEEEKTGFAYCSVPKRYHSAEEIMQRQGLYLTRDVFITSRFRSTWQGMIKNIRGEIVGCFESDLDFLNLLYDRDVTEDCHNKNAERQNKQGGGKTNSGYI